MENQKQKQKSLTGPHLIALGLIFVLFYSLTASTVLLKDANKLIHRQSFLISESSLPQPIFKSWKDGLVTTLKPELPRNCQKLFSGNRFEIRRQKGYVARWRNEFKDRDLLTATSNCSWVKDYFYNNLYITKLEKSFPIAFTFLVHNSPQQIVRLLKVLHRPHNQYCIAPDLKSAPEFIETFRNIALCLDNVHIVSKLLEVRWGHRSIMESQMQCYKDLLKIREKQPEHLRWKYVINLCGKELPLNTNHNIVARLVRLNGTSAIAAEKIHSKDTYHIGRLRRRKIPYGLPYYKSMTYMALSFQFVDFLFSNSTSVQLFNFFKECRMPEEHYYATVYMLPNVPGGYDPGIPKNDYFITSNYFWRQYHVVVRSSMQCSGSIVHSICVVDVGDIQRILTNTSYGETAIFQNKYFMEKDHVVMDCMEERIVAKNKLEFKEDRRYSQTHIASQYILKTFK